MKENLMKLLNTMRLVETKGDSTKIMAQCLQFVEMLVVECETASKSETTVSTADPT